MFAIRQRFSMIMAMMAQEPEVSFDFRLCEIHSKSTSMKALVIASCGLFGKNQLLKILLCRFFRRNSAQELPPWPSYTPKKWIVGQCFTNEGLGALAIAIVLSSFTALYLPLNEVIE